MIKTGFNFASISFSFSGLEELYKVNELTVNYNEEIQTDDNMLVNLFLSFCLHFLSTIYSSVTLHTKLGVSPNTKTFWERFLNKVRKKQFPSFVLNINANLIDSLPLYNTEVKSRIACLYGGGVESNYVLASFYPLNPLLIIYEGKDLMNERSGKNKIKRDLLKKLCKEKELEVKRIEIPFRDITLSKLTESQINDYLIGTIFYFFFLPLTTKYNISLIFNGQEREDIPEFHPEGIRESPKPLRDCPYQFHFPQLQLFLACIG